MSESKAGNIEAIRDWSKRYFYTKADVSEFFTKLNTGLTAYKLTIIGPANESVNIVEDYQTDPQEYNIKLSSNGNYTGLFFFHAGSILTATGDSVSATLQLDDYIDTIYLVSISELVPAMTSNTTPNTVGQVIYSSEYGGYPGFYAFDKNNGTRWNGSNNATEEYIGYQFFDKVCVAKIAFKPFSSGTNICFKHAFLQCSNDNITWANLKEIEVPNVVDDYEFNIPVESAYYYFRLYCDDSHQPQPTGKAYSLWYLQFYGYEP